MCVPRRALGSGQRSVIWIVAVVLLGLIVVLAQMLLIYQKRSHELRLKMEPIRRRIHDHRSTTAEIFARIQERSAERLAELEGFLDVQEAKLEEATASFHDLDDEELLQALDES